MSMTREEAITYLQEKYDFCKSFYDLAAHPEEDYPEMAKYLQALQIALTALRPARREQVEKAWTAEWTVDEFGHKCSKCGEYLPDGEDVRKPQFCPECGRAMTDEAVEMVMRRLEDLHEEN